MRFTWAFGLTLVVMVTAGSANAWNVELPDTVVIHGSTARLADICTGPLPVAATDLVIQAGGRPGTAVTVSQRTILRRLVSAGLARGVAMKGSRNCVLVFSGDRLDAARILESVRASLQRLVPAPRPDAPDSWFTLELPDTPLNAGPRWKIECVRNAPLEPGRNAVQCDLVDGLRRTSFTVTAVLHAYGEVATAMVAVPRGQPLLTDHFRWEWRDLAGERGKPLVGRESLPGFSTARSIAAGDPLLVRDVKATPIVRQNDVVELYIVRGSVAVRVLAKARREGCLGQVIPVRNELTGQLVNARVAAPGVVEWRN